jgi:hypothetical protein
VRDMAFVIVCDLSGRHRSDPFLAWRLRSREVLRSHQANSDAGSLPEIISLEDVVSSVTVDRFPHSPLVEGRRHHGRIARSSPVGFGFQTQPPIE